MASSGSSGGGDSEELQTTLHKLNQVLKQILSSTADPPEDLKVDRFLDQVNLQLQQPGQ